MPALIGGSPWRVTEEIVKGFNPKSVFRERERESEKVTQSIRRTYKMASFKDTP